jgi:hypothetical protein
MFKDLKDLKTAFNTHEAFAAAFLFCIFGEHFICQTLVKRMGCKALGNPGRVPLQSAGGSLRLPLLQNGA